MKRKTILATFALYVLALHAIVAVALFKTDLAPRALAKLKIGPPASTAHAALQNRLFLTYRDPIVPPGFSVFFGDSITHGLVTSAVAPESVNFGIGMQTSTDLLNRLSEFTSIRTADTVYLMIGINDIFKKNEGDLHRNYLKILDIIPPNTKLVWSGLMPAKKHNEAIRRTNTLINELCNARQNCVYIDTFSAMIENYENNFTDGVHPSPEGYRIWINLLSAAIGDEHPATAGVDQSGVTPLARSRH